VEEEETLAGDGELILLVDDEAAVREISRMSLEANGYRVLVASDGAEAVATYAQRQSEIDLVITDIDMPLMGGQAMVHAIRRINPGVKVIGSSGTSESSKLGHLKETGFDDFLSKPYPVQALLKTIKEVLESRARE
ncbi:MAG TPA: response regulator, partial [Terriglobia bacterium]|nr:response regulator [Terriglobia bacterium]